MTTRAPTLLLAATLAMMAAGPAGATSSHPFTLAELTWTADRVIAGTVLSQQTSFTPDGSLIVTHVQLQVDEALKGPTGESTVWLWVLGGTTPGGTTLHVEGTARFTTGEQVLVFLEDSPHGLAVVGWTQGRFGLRFSGARDEITATGGPHELQQWGTQADHDAAVGYAEIREAVLDQIRTDAMPQREIPGLPEHKRATLRTHLGVDR
jgi:hypothetical protein